jgi:hypothetical protein
MPLDITLPLPSYPFFALPCLILFELYETSVFDIEFEVSPTVIVFACSITLKPSATYTAGTEIDERR